MSGNLTLTLRFPLGQYQAHDGRGNAEWPPSPARLATSLLATAYDLHDAEAVRVTRSLYHLPAPAITTPPATERHTAYSRWAPVDVTLDDKGKTGRGGLSPKIAKPAERGTLIGDGATTFTWPATLPQADLTVLDRVLLEVPYLGRPTSPVIINRTTTDAHTQESATRWDPDPAGPTALNIATPRLLAALDARERERDMVGVTGHHPRLSARSQGRYRVTHVGGPTGLVYQRATKARVAQAVTSVAFQRTPGAVPEDIGAVVDALLEGAHPGAFVAPVYGVSSEKGMESRRLFGAVTHGVLGVPRSYVSGRDLVDLPALKPGAPSQSAKTVIAQTWGTAHAWTTSAPVHLDRDELVTDVQNMADTFRVEIVEAQTHDAPRDPNGMDTATHPFATHLSVLFNAPVTGPVIHRGLALKPIHNGGEA